MNYSPMAEGPAAIPLAPRAAQRAQPSQQSPISQYSAAGGLDYFDDFYISDM